MRSSKLLTAAIKEVAGSALLRTYQLEHGTTHDMSDAMRLCCEEDLDVVQGYLICIWLTFIREGMYGLPGQYSAKQINGFPNFIQRKRHAPHFDKNWKYVK